VGCIDLVGMSMHEYYLAHVVLPVVLCLVFYPTMSEQLTCGVNHYSRTIPVTEKVVHYSFDSDLTTDAVGLVTAVQVFVFKDCCLDFHMPKNV